MKVVVLNRLSESDEGIFGELCVPSKVFKTAELPYLDNKSNISSIPLGEYTCKMVNSPRFGRVYEVTNVKDRTNILIHRGNWAGNTTIINPKTKNPYRSDINGCILLGLGISELENQKAVTSSKAAITEFHNIMGEKEFKLIIQ